jgi:hypothetical protein
MAISTATVPGQILTSAYVNNNINSGLVYVTSVTGGTLASTITVNNCFSATYDAYRIVYTGGTATDNGAIAFAFNGSPAGWYGNIVYADFANGAPSSLGASNLTSAPFIGGASAGFPQVLADIQNPFLAQPSWASGNYTDAANAGRSTYYHASSTSYTGFILTKTLGTLTGGVVTVYGYRKA